MSQDDVRLLIDRAIRDHETTCGVLVGVDGCCPDSRDLACDLDVQVTLTPPTPATAAPHQSTGGACVSCVASKALQPVVPPAIPAALMPT
jgi:hypothetical protein